MLLFANAKELYATIHKEEQMLSRKMYDKFTCRY